jgi:hypothetical protein
VWYRITLGAADCGSLPIRGARTVLAGPCLEDLVAEAATQIVTAFDQTRPSDHQQLRGLLEVGLEIEQWTTQTDLLARDGEAEGFRRAMRCSLLRSPFCSPT